MKVHIQAHIGHIDLDKWQLVTLLNFYLLSPLKRHGFCTNVELFDEYNVTSSEGTYRF